MAFSIEKLKAAFVRAWQGDEPKHATTEAELEQFWIPQPPPTYGVATLPVNANAVISSSAPYHYANGHIGSPPLGYANGFSNVVFSETEEIEVEESTESEIANMGKAKEPERKRFKTIAMAPPPEQRDETALAIKSGKDFRVFYTENNEIFGIGETDTLDNAKLMVKAKYGKQAVARRKVDLGRETPHVDVVDRNATIVRQFELV